MARVNKKVGKKIKDIKSLKTKEILNMDVYKLNNEGLREVTKKLIRTANQRIDRLKIKAPNSKALRWHQEHFKIQGIKKNDRNATEKLMKEVRAFLKSYTSTLRGWMKEREDIENKLGAFESVEQENDFWNLYTDWISKNPTLTEIFNDTNELQQMIYDRFVTQGKSARGAKISMTQAVKKLIGMTNKKESENDALKRKELKSNDSIKGKPNF